jgi:hypothetical protein
MSGWVSIYACVVVQKKLEGTFAFVFFRLENTAETVDLKLSVLLLDPDGTSCGERYCTFTKWVRVVGHLGTVGRLEK